VFWLFICFANLYISVKNISPCTPWRVDVKYIHMLVSHVTGPNQGFLVSPLVLTRKPWERGCPLITKYQILEILKENYCRTFLRLFFRSKTKSQCALQMQCLYFFAADDQVENEISKRGWGRSKWRQKLNKFISLVTFI
jgi:hypothetical protein